MMSPERQLRVWLIGFGVFVALLWLLAGVLLPFVAGMAIAYFLDPLVDRLERWRVPRTVGSILVLIGFALVLVAVILLVVPVLQAQIIGLAESLPGYVEAARERFMPLARRLLRNLSPADVERLRGMAGNFAGELMTWLGTVVQGIVTGGLALFDVLSILFITPVVAFYLMRDWDRMVNALDRWLPRRKVDIIRAQAREVDRTLAGFVRGQASVCVVLGLFYALSLTAAGLTFGFSVGLLAGLLSFIPYVGSLVGFVTSTGLAMLQFQEWWSVGVVAAIFVVGQAVEGNVLTPKLVGERVGLHPVWVIFALLAGGYLVGFLGVLVALPVAAVIGVLVRFTLRQYLASDLYSGDRPLTHEPAEPARETLP